MDHIQDCFALFPQLFLFLVPSGARKNISVHSFTAIFLLPPPAANGRGQSYLMMWPPLLMSPASPAYTGVEATLDLGLKGNSLLAGVLVAFELFISPWNTMDYSTYQFFPLETVLGFGMWGCLSSLHSPLVMGNSLVLCISNLAEKLQPKSMHTI